MATRDPFSVLQASWDAVVEDTARRGRDASDAEIATDLCAAVDRFCAAEVDSLAIDREGRLGGAILEKAARLGLFGLTVPVDHGGAGLSMLAASRVVTRIARWDGSLATSVGLHCGLALAPLIEHGSSALRVRYLPDLAAGRRIASFAATEPEAGSDIASIRTTARRGADALSLQGDKAFVTNGGVAGFVTVLARTPELGGGRASTSLLAVDPRWKGVQRGREEHKMGLRGSSTIALAFDDVSVPLDHVIGEPGAGLALFQRALWWGRTLLSAGCLGSAESAVERAVAHVRARRQFGRPLARFELVRDHVARMRARELVMQSLIAVVGARHSRGGDVGWESSACKIACSEGAFSTIDTALQLHGGAGYIEETGISRRLRDCRVTRIFEGANDVLRLHVAASVLSWDLEGLLRGVALARRVGAPLTDVATRLEAESAPALTTVAEVVRRTSFRLVERQLLSARIADALVDLYGLFAALAVVEGDRRHGRDVGVAAARLALIVDRTLPRVQRLVETLDAPPDATLDVVAGVDLAEP